MEIMEKSASEQFQLIRFLCAESFLSSCLQVTSLIRILDKNSELRCATQESVMFVASKSADEVV